MAAGSRRGWLALARHVAGIAAGGYLLLMATVIAYYYGVARVAGDFIKSAFTGTARLQQGPRPAAAGPQDLGEAYELVYQFIRKAGNCRLWPAGSKARGPGGERNPAARIILLAAACAV